MEEQKSRRTWSAAVWVLIVLVIGVVLGGILAWTVPVPQGPPSTGPHAAPPPPLAVTQTDVLLSTVSLVLLAALLGVYARSYRTTRAPFVLGLMVFLIALLFETALNSPLLFAAFGIGPGNLRGFLALSELLMNVALSVFLYLSLQ